jgi:hypothetical protein
MSNLDPSMRIRVSEQPIPVVERLLRDLRDAPVVEPRVPYPTFFQQCLDWISGDSYDRRLSRANAERYMVRARVLKRKGQFVAAANRLMDAACYYNLGGDKVRTQMALIKTSVLLIHSGGRMRREDYRLASLMATIG